MKYLKFNSIFILVFLLVGCSYVSKFDKSNEYKNAPVDGKILVLPSGVSVEKIDDHYPVPKAHRDNIDDASYLPPGGSLRGK
jgi:uncharacterized lipoprotein